VTGPGFRSREAREVRDVAPEDIQQVCDVVAFEGEMCWERGAQYLFVCKLRVVARPAEL
jgi:hypothetical protein